MACAFVLPCTCIAESVCCLAPAAEPLAAWAWLFADGRVTDSTAPTAAAAENRGTVAAGVASLRPPLIVAVFVVAGDFDCRLLPLPLPLLLLLTPLTVAVLAGFLPAGTEADEALAPDSLLLRVFRCFFSFLLEPTPWLWLCGVSGCPGAAG